MHRQTIANLNNPLLPGLFAKPPNLSVYSITAAYKMLGGIVNY